MIAGLRDPAQDVISTRSGLEVAVRPDAWLVAMGIPGSLKSRD
jgi:hypothetical protein